MKNFDVETTTNIPLIVNKDITMTVRDQGRPRKRQSVGYAPFVNAIISRVTLNAESEHKKVKYLGIPLPWSLIQTLEHCVD